MLDPQAQAVLDLIAAAGRPPLHTLSAQEARAQYRAARKALQPPPEDVAAVRDLTAPGPHGPIPVRLYRARGTADAERLPVLVYFHGGGFTIGDLDTHDGVCRTLANEARCAVVSVDYRLGPEHKFPCAVDDSFAATRWVAQEAAALGIDARRIAVGGDSAGGNLATVVALLARDAGGPPLAAQVLIYPTTTLEHDTPSTAEFGPRGYIISLDTMHYFRDSYLSAPEERRDWRASPLLAPDVSRLPPAFILTAGCDPLRDEGKAYAERLRAAGVEVRYTCYEGQIHGFITMGRMIDAAGRALRESAAALRNAFAT
ncbi:MAG TPA: alpha/beta hydrolase [Burkholderiales bacterium]